ncbi:protein kinase [Streptomyces sp. NPDC048442]|uniref:serine/threonine-protein kinase n=1 Tax=Streptomyces sp. NPDC048442 TaxID=3154823 RepID=UPI00341DB224
MEKLGPSDPQRIGAYRLLARLGAGGMGQVYLARSDRGRTVAVKLVRRELAEQEEFRSRFRQEVQAARRVGGRWTAPVLDANTEAEVPWVATGYVAGPTLQQVVSGGHGPLPERSVLVLAAGLTHALQDIHSAGLIHRDLKPSNVLVTIDGPRVIDFGIARALETVTDSGLTRTGALVGSPGFMAPEQIRGDRVTAACDVFCLGSVLSYAATGKLPFGTAHSGVHALMFRIAQEAPDLSEVPESLHDLIRDCLQKPPAARPTLDQLLTRTGPGPTPGDPWLPASLVAQLGIHAVQLLDLENPTTSFATDAVPQPNATGGGPGGGPGSSGGGTASGSGTPHAPAAPGEATPPAAPAGPSNANPYVKSVPEATPPPTPGRDGQGSQSSQEATPSTPGTPSTPASPTPTSAPAPGTPPPPGAPHHPGGAAGSGGVHFMPTYIVPPQPGAPDGPGTPDQPPAPGTPHGPAQSHPLPPANPNPNATPYGYPNSPTPYGHYGYPQGAPHAPHSPQDPYGYPTPPGSYGYPPTTGPSTGTGAGGPTPRPRSSRSTLALIAVALVVAIGSGGAVYAFMNSGDDTKSSDSSSAASPGHTGDGKSPTEQGGSDAQGPTDPDPTTDTPTTEAPTTGTSAIPSGFLGTWSGYVNGDPRVLTLKQGKVGDPVLSLVADGPSYHCLFEARLSSAPGASGPLSISSSIVVTGPAASCRPGKESTIVLLPDGSLRRTTPDGKSVTYTR